MYKCPDPSGNHVIHLTPFNVSERRMGAGRDIPMGAPWLGTTLSGETTLLMGSAIDYSEDIAETVLQSYDNIQCSEKTGKDGRKYLIFTNGTDAPVVVSILTTAADTMVSFCNLLLPLKRFLNLTEARRLDDDPTDDRAKVSTHDIRDMRPSLLVDEQPLRVSFIAENESIYTVNNIRMETFLKILTELTERYHAPQPIPPETPMVETSDKTIPYEILQPM